MGQPPAVMQLPEPDRNPRFPSLFDTPPLLRDSFDAVEGETRWDVDLILGHYRPRILKLNRQVRVRSYAVGYIYKVTCPCGEVSPMTAEEVIRRDLVGLGCCRLTCPVPDNRVRFWYTPAMALKFQALQMRYLWPHLLPQQGIGITSDEIVQQWLDSPKLSQQLDRGLYWFSDAVVADEAEDVPLLRYPCEQMFPKEDIWLLQGSKLVPLRKLSRTYNVPRETLLAWRLREDDDNLVLVNAIGETYGRRYSGSTT